MREWFAEDRADAGFTIVELLVGLCILGLLSTYAVAALQNIRRMDRLMREIETRSGIEAVETHLHHLISGARPVVGTSKGESHPMLAFTGEENRLELIIASDGVLETGGLYASSIATRRRDDGFVDLIARRRLFRLSSSRGEGKALVLYERIASLRFRYFGQVRPEEPAGWHDRWMKTDRLPRLIEVVVTMPEGERQSWPRLVIRPASGS
jgi:prepilin-type N-terminal cleavage/methylation domain-containing protein